MISVAVPAYNEERHLAETVANIVQAAARAGGVAIEIIIVNDGSRDRTGEVIRDLERRYEFVRPLQHQVNSGLGTSITDALAAARYPKFMIVPGDNDMSPELIAQLFLHHDKADLVLAYYVNKEDRGRVRNIISTLFGLAYMCTFNVFVQYINSPCLYPTELLRKFRLKSRRFSIVAEMTSKCLRSGCSFHEIPGYMQTGLAGSTSLRLRNLIEVISTYLRLVYEIKVRKTADFSKRPVRVF